MLSKVCEIASGTTRMFFMCRANRTVPTISPRSGQASRRQLHDPCPTASDSVPRQLHSIAEGSCVVAMSDGRCDPEKRRAILKFSMWRNSRAQSWLARSEARYLRTSRMIAESATADTATIQECQRHPVNANSIAATEMIEVETAGATSITEAPRRPVATTTAKPGKKKRQIAAVSGPSSGNQVCTTALLQIIHEPVVASKHAAPSPAHAPGHGASRVAWAPVVNAGLVTFEPRRRARSGPAR